ncbi:MAG: hypothetical protein ABIH46_12860 [Chloroflexota bacterium]
MPKPDGVTAPGVSPAELKREIQSLERKVLGEVQQLRDKVEHLETHLKAATVAGQELANLKRALLELARRSRVEAPDLGL